MDRCARLLLLHAPVDEELVKQLKLHFAPLERAGQVSFLLDWPGDDRQDPQGHEQADVILVLLSPDLLASAHCDAWIERSLRSRARVIVVQLRSTLIPPALQQLPILPRQPVTAHLDPSAALLQVVQYVCVLLSIRVSVTADEAPAAPETRVLHCADPHISSPDSALWCAQQIVEDLRRLRCSSLDGLVLSGGLTRSGAPAEYAAARRFFTELMAALGLSREQVLLVPGASDCKQGIGPFADLHQDLLGAPYPENPAEQCIVRSLGGLTFLGLNSAMELPPRVHQQALHRALATLAPHRHRVVVWHHPLHSAEPERLQDTAFLQDLAAVGIRVVFHGNLSSRDAARLFYEFAYADQRFQVIAAGRSGVLYHSDAPRSYNLLRLRGDLLRVQVRSRTVDHGLWSECIERPAYQIDLTRPPPG